MKTKTAKKAVILLSGGVDSSTALAIAKEQEYACYALSIDYKQRNSAELKAAQAVASALGVVEHRIVKMELGNWGGSALTDHSLQIPQQFSQEIPITYVPARNTIFLSTALAWAEVLGAFDIFIGANVVDYSNYPDCRPEFLNAFEKLANLATKVGTENGPFKIHAPLLQLSKAEIIRKGLQLGLDYSITLSCYDPSKDGDVCHVCDACRHRTKGFLEVGVEDARKSV
jgi:7-cyano-7-deazaguanine synthase